MTSWFPWQIASESDQLMSLQKQNALERQAFNRQEAYDYMDLRNPPPGLSSFAPEHGSFKDPFALASFNRNVLQTAMKLPLSGRDDIIMLNLSQFMSYAYGLREEEIIVRIANVCSDINDAYAIKSIKNAFLSMRFAIFFAMRRSDYHDVGGGDVGKVLGFLIAEKGECEELKNSWTINLVCVRKIPGNPVKGSMLVGLYLYLAKLSGQSAGLLELAGGQTNLAGLCSYSKFGFKEFNPLGDKCFDAENNLPMIVDLHALTLQDVIDISRGTKSFPKPKECSITDTALQQRTAEQSFNKFRQRHMKTVKQLKKLGAIEPSEITRSMLEGEGFHYTRSHQLPTIGGKRSRKSRKHKKRSKK